MKKILFGIFLITFIFISGLHSQSEDSSQVNNPIILTEYVTDETATLTQAQVENLRKKLKSFRDSTSTQIVVYMINTLNGEPIENVSYSIAEKNKIGRKGYNNGVLLLIAKTDRKLRIEVGYGLEGVLTDAMSKHISRNEITPHFKNNDYFTGIDNGVNAIISVVKGEYHLNVKEIKPEKKYSPGDDTWMIILIVSISFGLPVIIIIVAIIRGKKGYSRGSGNTYYSGGSSSSSNSSSSSSSDSSSSSSSDSGFSGDGGSFGGGGASDSW